MKIFGPTKADNELGRMRLELDLHDIDLIEGMVERLHVLYQIEVAMGSVAIVAPFAWQGDVPHCTADAIKMLNKILDGYDPLKYEESDSDTVISYVEES